MKSTNSAIIQQQAKAGTSAEEGNSNLKAEQQDATADRSRGGGRNNAD